MARRAAHKDAYHDAIGKLFADDGWDTLDLFQMGEGCPDWLMVKGWFAFLLEVKSPKEIRKRSASERYSEKQHKFRAARNGERALRLRMSRLRPHADSWASLAR